MTLKHTGLLKRIRVFLLQFSVNVNCLVTYWCDSESLCMLWSCECKWDVFWLSWVMIVTAHFTLQCFKFMSVKQACGWRKQPFPCKRGKLERNQDVEGVALKCLIQSLLGSWESENIKLIFCRSYRFVLLWRLIHSSGRMYPESCPL